MTAAVIWALILLALLLLLQIRVGAEAEYAGEEARVWLRLGPVRVRLFPRRARAERRSAHPKKEIRERPAEKPKARRHMTAAEALDYLSALLPVALEAAGRFRRKLCIDVLHLELQVGGSDPGEVALRYGQASAVLGGLWGPLDQAFQIRDGLVRVEPDFGDNRTSRLSGRIVLSLKMGQILWLGLYFGLKGLKRAMSVKKEHDTIRIQKQRKAV